MKKFILPIILFFLLGYTYVSGHKIDLIQILQFRGISSTSVSPTNKAKMYYDSEDDKLKISENGGTYTNIMGVSSFDTEVELESLLTDVTDIYTNNDFTDNSSNWNTAYGWGDHASGGYLKADGSVDLSSNWTIATNSITLTAGTLTASALTDGTVSLSSGVFDVFPLTPSSAPVNDYDVANKKYVDDNAGGSSTIIVDSDGDTSIDTERNADEDLIRIELAGDDVIVYCGVLTDEGINSAIDVLGADGGTVILAEGTFVINDEIDIDANNTRIIGSGKGTILDSSSWSAPGAASAVINLNNYNFCTFKDFSIAGNYLASRANVRAVNDGGDYNIYDNLYIYNWWWNYADIFRVGDYARITNCTFFQIKRHFTLAIRPVGIGAIISGNVFNDVGGGVFSAGNYTIVSNNYFRNIGNVYYAIQFGSAFSVATGNHISLGADVGIEDVAGSEGTVIVGNYISVTNTCVDLQGDRSIVNGNYFEVAVTGIDLAATADSTIIGINEYDVTTAVNDSGTNTVQGITDNTSYWLCTANDCSTTCQATIKQGMVTGCP